MSSSLEWKDRPVKYLRDKVVDQLKYNLANDHLEIDEFEQLVRIALSTPSKSELLSLTTDLPTIDSIDPKVQAQELIAYDNKESVTCILSESRDKKLGKLPKQLKVLTVMGDSEVDLRDVELDADLTYITLACWLGNSKIIVPPDVNVVLNVKNVLSSLKNESPRRMNPDSPTIVIDGKVILGEVTISLISN